MRPARRRTLAGYELEHRLGEGATSTVWRARQVSSLGRPVALKWVHDREAARTEVEALAALDHPHVVRVFELVEDGDDVAIAMQLATGGSLDERLRRRGPLPAGEVTEVLAKLAGALGSAHRRGLLHRDVKPANVLFTADGEPLLSDFGLSSDDGRIRGSRAYLDPTVLAGRAPDAAADLYGLGAVAFEMLTARPPSPGEALSPEVPAVLAGVVARLLAPDPSGRFASAEEVVVALAAGEAPAAVEVEQPDASVTRDFGPRPPQPVAAVRGRRRWPLVAAGLVLLVVGVAISLRPPDSDPAPEPAATIRRCPAVAVASADVVVGDTDGDGCPEAVGRSGNVLEHEGVRYALGDDGDLALLGDWDCDGVATPGVRRAGTGEVHGFDGWAGDDPLEAVGVVAEPDCS